MTNPRPRNIDISGIVSIRLVFVNAETLPRTLLSMR
jgi:hypothetical protein